MSTGSSPSTPWCRPGRPEPPAPGANNPRVTTPLAHIVLVEPEIPNNTGNIGRTCVTLGCVLHLVHPLGFDTDEKACRRAGLDYWPRLDLREHDDFEGYERSREPGAGVWYLSARARRSILDAPIRRADHFVFGRESVGLAPGLLASRPDRAVSFPMVPGERSLNLSTGVGCVLTVLMLALEARGEMSRNPDGTLNLRDIPNKIRSE